MRDGKEHHEHRSFSYRRFSEEVFSKQGFVQSLGTVNFSAGAGFHSGNHYPHSILSYGYSVTFESMHLPVETKDGSLTEITFSNGNGYYIATWIDGYGNSSIVYDPIVCRWTIQDLDDGRFFGFQYDSQGE